MKKKIYIETGNVKERGCFSLYYQIRKILGYIGDSYIFTKESQNADYIFILSCIVIPKMVDFSIHCIKEKIKLNPDAKIILYGCISKKIQDRFIGFFGDRLIIISHEQTDLLNNIFKTKKDFNQSSEYNGKDTILDETSYAFEDFSESNHHIVINKGCKHNCSFCITREGRKIKSLQIKTIIENIHKKYQEGIKHFRITSDDISTYGIDNNANLIELLNRILKEFGDVTLDLGPIYPSYIVENKQGLYQLFQTGRIMRVFSAIQHRKKHILKSMNRGDYNHQEFEKFLILTKRTYPHIIFSTHLIYGYPGETDQDFLDNLKNINIFDSIQLYGYSQNDKTERIGLDNPNMEIIKKRHKLINTIITNIEGLRIQRDSTKTTILNSQIPTHLRAAENYF